jgi:carbon-monoxide dehydrogenase small subunit
MTVTIIVNGEQRATSAAGWESLLSVLRDEFGLRGSKDACEQGECGSCTVILDGESVCSCLVMVGDCDGARVATVEGLVQADILHAVQEALLEAGGVQCGFCTPGFAVAGAHLLEQSPHPTEDEIKEALAGNICRCTGYGAILRAFVRLAGGDEA